MVDEPNDLSEDWIDNVEPSEADDPEFIEEADPLDEDDGSEDESEGTDDETDATETEDEAEGQESEGEPETTELADDVMVKMADGTQVSLRELKDSPMFKADHTRKTQELKEAKTSVQADAERIEAITQAFVDHVSAMVPAAPDPSLALTNPNQYTAAEAQHRAAMAQVEKLLKAGEEIKQVSSKMTQADQQQHLQAEDVLLRQAVPEANDPKKRAEFFADVQKTGNAMGFTDAELGEMAMDHRYFVLAKWAKAGMDADKAKSNAKVKAQKAPPVTPRKPGAGANKPNNKANAKRRLMEDDSIENAIAFLTD